MKKILVIEDNNEINQLITETLSEYQVMSAYSGTEGILLFQHQPFDLILLDIMLPGMDGAAVLKKIRQTSQVPVIMLTALGDKKKTSQFLLKGANDYITKPFDFDELLARVAVQLRQAPTKEIKKELMYKNIRLLEESFEIEAFEEKIRLGKKEFEIFKHLLNQPTQIFTKEQLYESIWQETYFSTDNTLNSHLSNLRKKIKQLDSTEEYIETIWGLGIRLAGENND